MQTRFQRKTFSNRSISEDAIIRRLEIIEQTDVAKVYGRILDATRGRAARMFKVYRGRDILFGTLSAALSIITSYREIYSPEGVMSMKSILEDLAYPLIEPVDGSKLESFLKNKGIKVSDPKLRNAVDALHLLEFYAYTYPRSTFMDRIQEVDSELFEEALTLAKILRGIGDEEAGLADNVVRKYHGEVIE